VVIFNESRLEGLGLACHISNAVKDITQAELAVIARIVQHETQEPLFLGILRDKPIDGLAVVVIGALVREVQHFNHDLREARRVALFQEF